MAKVWVKSYYRDGQKIKGHYREVDSAILSKQAKTTVRKLNDTDQFWGNLSKKDQKILSKRAYYFGKQQVASGGTFSNFTESLIGGDAKQKIVSAGRSMVSRRKKK